jgi:hypothetical protein
MPTAVDMKKMRAFAKLRRGNITREFHLAYGLARDVPYVMMERTCHNIPCTFWVAKELYLYGMRVEGVKDDEFEQTRAIDNAFVRPRIAPVPAAMRQRKLRDAAE